MIATSLTAYGCGPGDFASQADRQALSLVSDRQRETLEYEPGVSVPGGEVAGGAGKPAYDKVPTTQLPSVGDEPIFLTPTLRKYRKLGPSLDDLVAAQVM